MFINRWTYKAAPYIKNEILPSAVKMNEIMPAKSNVDGPRDYHIKWSKRKIKHLWYPLNVKSKKNDANDCIYKTEIDTDKEKQT